MQVLLNDQQQLDATLAPLLAQSPEVTVYEMVKALLFDGNFRVSGAAVNQDATPDGSVSVDPGVFVQAGIPGGTGGTAFYSNLTEAEANIISGTPNPAANVWGTGQAADPTNPRIDIVCVAYNKVPGSPQLKTFINATTTPPTFYTQTVNTVSQSQAQFTVVHGTPSATPAAPATPNGYMLLATVTVPANATTITNADIENNFSIDVSSLQDLQIAQGAQSAFSDLLHGNGVYQGYLGSLQVAETSPQSMAVEVANGTALYDGDTVAFPNATLVPIQPPSFFSISSEVISFASGDVQNFNTNGTPPHKIRAGSVVITGYIENTDYSVQYAAGTITRLPGGIIPAGGSVYANYDYYLPRIDLIQVTFNTGLITVVQGTPAQTPVAPSVSSDSIILANVAVGEAVTVIVNGNITDERVYLFDVEALGNEVVAARTSPESGVNGSLMARLNAHENRSITSSVAVHGIKQGSGNAFDADTVDGDHASDIVADSVAAVEAVTLVGDVVGTLLANSLKTLTPPVPAGTYGDGSNVPVVTVDGKGRVTAASTTPISYPSAFPSGFLGHTAIAASAVPTAMPGWVVRDGSAISRTGIGAALFAIFGTQFGVGDGSTTFNLPDDRGVADIGAGLNAGGTPGMTGLTVKTLYNAYGEELHVLTTAEMPSHTHDNPYSTAVTSAGGVASGSLTEQQDTQTGATGGGLAHNNIQPSRAYTPIIKL